VRNKIGIRIADWVNLQGWPINWHHDGNCLKTFMLSKRNIKEMMCPGGRPGIALCAGREYGRGYHCDPSWKYSITHNRGSNTCQTNGAVQAKENVKERSWFSAVNAVFNRSLVLLGVHVAVRQ
jgi:hypothetical protein